MSLLSKSVSFCYRASTTTMINGLKQCHWKRRLWHTPSSSQSLFTGHVFREDASRVERHNHRHQLFSSYNFAMGKSKFYAVARGKIPGIYNSWEDCEKQVKGFKKALFKSFPNKEQAQEFLEKNSPPTSESMRKHPETNDDAPSKKSKPTIRMTLHFDGGSRGNGKTYSVAGSGAALKIIDEMYGKKETICIRKYLDKADVKGHHKLSNNYAEYTGLIIGLKEIQNRAGSLGGACLEVYGDSNLVIEQLKGNNECRAENITGLFREAKRILNELRRGGLQVELKHVFRSDNAEADMLANEAMDQRRSWNTSSIINTRGKKSDAQIELV